MPEPWTDRELEQWNQCWNEELTRENIEEFLIGLPDETNPDYYPQIKELFNIEDTEIRNEIVNNIYQSDELKIQTDGHVDDVRFAAFYFLANHARRKSNTEDFLAWIERGRQDFQNRPLYQYMESILYREQNKYPHAINKCRPVFNEYSDNWPIAVGFAHNIIHGIEEELVGANQKKELAQEALNTIKMAIQSKPDYGKSYLIKARALAVLGRFEEALDEVDRAIEKEDSKKEDYAERIADRYFHRVRIEVSQQKHQLERQTREVEDRMDNMQSRFVQLLGFFAAILAVVFTSTQIAVSLGAQEAVGVVIVLTGGLISGFASLSLLLPGNLDMYRVITVIGFGLAGIAGGVYLVMSTV